MSQSDERLIPSVLDRLIDEQPHRRRETPASRMQVLQQMKTSVGRDLQNLLNTRCRATSWDKGLDQLAVSLVAYGIPDCVGINTGSRDQQEELRATIERAVDVFEPRLFNVRVRLVESEADHDRTLRFRIDALLRIDPSPEPVAYDSELDASLGDFQVRGARR